MSWHASRLGDVLTLKRGHDLPDSQRQDGNVPVVSSSGITGRHSEPKAKAPGVVTGRYGTLGQVFYLEEDYWPLNTALYVTDFKGNHPRFVAYFLQGILRNYQSDKAAVPGVNRNVLHDLKVRCPDTTIQERIAGILAAYDELIENNQRRMALLEEAARQLYREWFVRLRFPGYEHTRITNGVPYAWERRPLESCAIFRSGGTPSKARSEYWEGDIPWVSSGEMSETRIYDTSLHVSSEGAEAGSRLISPNTILIVVRGMSLAKEFRLATVAREMAFNQDLKALESRDSMDSLFLFHSLLDRREGIRELATEASHGTKKLDTAVLERLPILVAELRLQRLFRDTVASSLALRDNLYHQNARLRAARNLLLPRLMSGEIAV
jgi:type I restriction enzyme S subunit